MNVLLLRSRDGGQPYLDRMHLEGWTSECFEPVSYTFHGQEPMRASLRRPDQYGGLVITSPRTLEAWRRDPESREALRAWADKPAFAVGPRTAHEARELGLTPAGSEARGADALAGFIGRNPPSKPLLFCCGEPRRPELVGGLSAAGVEVDVVSVYASHLASASPDTVPDWVVFFSPRAGALRHTWVWPWGAIRQAWVGKTASALAPPGAVTADYHDVDGLVQGIIGASD
ncbi:MAG: uroporphyrinogen-III synthase [Rhodothermales bacterium]